MRTGLVLGAGGVLGAAWTIGALAALQEVREQDPREADVLLGTSAGSVLASFLGCGVGVDVLLDHQRGIVNAEAPDISYDPDSDSGGALPPLPRPGIGSARGVLS
nr:patatin-like phospholipase family protein [Actinomycetota bacterium]